MNPRGQRCSERGMVTAETAIVIPLIALFALGLAWMVITVTAQIQVVDAARDGARALARGEDEAAAVAHTSRVAPSGATVEVTEGAGSVTVEVEVEAEAPAWLLLPLPAVHLESQATVGREDGVR